MQLADDLTPEQAAAAKARTEKDRIAKLIEIADFRFVMSHKQGRRFVWRLLGKTGIFRSTFSDSHPAASFMEGQRNFGLDLLKDVNEHTPERYIELLTEIKDATGKSASDPNSTGS